MNEIKKYFKYLEDPFFKMIKKYGWHLTIKACLEINNNFQRYERRPMVSLENSNFLELKKSFTKIAINSKKILKKDYFKV